MFRYRYTFQKYLPHRAHPNIPTGHVYSVVVVVVIVVVVVVVVVIAVVEWGEGGSQWVGDCVCVTLALIKI